jgi:hypothetical protein
LWWGFVREVCFVDGSWRTIPFVEWSDFVDRQTYLLAADGFSRAQAQQFYEQARND